MPILWLVRQIRWFPYIAPSVVERQQATLAMPLNDRGISVYQKGSDLTNFTTHSVVGKQHKKIKINIKSQISKR